MASLIFSPVYSSNFLRHNVTYREKIFSYNGLMT